jgi:nicotinate phosphoribosyltransferase
MTNLTLLIDLYELTMLEGYYQCGKIDKRAIFDVFYREAPFNGAYAVFAGLEKVIQYLSDISFKNDDLEYLRSLALFSDGLIEYLKDFKFTGTVASFPEGSIIFPNEPILRVEATLGQAQIIETAILNSINFQTLVASKASRVCYAARGRPVVEFGLRRAQGEDGGISASRASYIGGCDGTSNVLAGKMFGIPVRGTHAHSWIMSFDSELEAFQQYSAVYPDKSILLVDTYDSISSGIPNAIRVAKQLEQKGRRLIGIRLDSGDVIAISKKTRQMFDDADLRYVKIFVSGDLDEYRIEELLESGAPVDMFGVGTRLATGHHDSALTGVYKMSAIEDGNGVMSPKLKISDEINKGTLPGKKNVIRYFNNDLMMYDVIYLEGEEINLGDCLYKMDGTSLRLPENVSEEKQLVPIFKEGSLVYRSPGINEIQHRYFADFTKLSDAYRALKNPERYTVLISEGLFTLRQQLREDFRIE